MSLSSKEFFYTNTNHNDASNVLINYNNLTGNSDLIQHPLSKYSKVLFFSPTYNNDLFNAINWANSLGIYKNQNNLINPLVNPLVNNVLINSQPFVSSVIQYRNIVAITQMGSYIDGSNNGDINGHSVSVSEDGLIMAVSARNFSGDNPNSNIGHVRIYEWYNNNWLQKGSDIIGENNNEKIGDSISLNAEGNIIAIGISEYNSGNGGVRIYEFISNTWTKIGELSGHNASIADHLEVSLSSDGKIVAYGSYMNNSGTGRFDVYKYVDNTWQSMGNIPGISAGEIFGAKLTLSADGNVLAASAAMYSDNGNNIGQVRIYKYINNIWEQIGSIDGESNDDYSGTSVSLNIDGTILAIGAMMNDGNEPDSNRGHVRVYKYLSCLYGGHNWIQMGNDIDGENEGDQFGWSVSLSNDGYILAIGAPSNKAIHSSWTEQYYSDVGQVQIFQYVQFSNKWVKMADTIYGENNDDQFGKSLSLSKNGSVLVVSAPYSACEEKPTNPQKGRVTVFNLLGSLEPAPQLQSKVTSFSKIGDDLYGTEDYGNLGGNLAMSGDGLTMIATSINTYNLAPTRNRGSVTVYKWINDNWVQKGSTIGGNNEDYLGHKVAISDDGDTILPSASRYGVKAYKYVNNNWVGSTVFNERFSYNRWYHDVDMNSDGTIVVLADFYNYPNHAGSIIVYKWNGSSWSQMGNEIIGDEDNHKFGSQVRLNASGNILAIHGVNNNTVYPNLNSSGVVRIYEYNDTDNQWEQMGGSFYGLRDNHLGYHLELSLDGHTIAMASNGNYDTTGKIIVYKWNNNSKQWLQHGNIIYGKESNASIGQNMKFNNDATMLVIGSGSSYKFTSSSTTAGGGGSIYVYQYVHGEYGGQWIYVFAYKGTNNTGAAIGFASDSNKLILHKNNVRHPTLKISASLGLGDQYRRSVGLNETYELIESQPEPEPVTNLSYSSFRIDKIIYTGNASAVNDRFGTNIAISKNGKIIAVSAPENDYNESGTYVGNIGSVTMYELINGSWSQLGDPIYGTQANEKIGEKTISLSSNGLIVAFASPVKYITNIYYWGSVKVYYWYNNAWTQMGNTITGPVNRSDATIGTSLSLNANGLIISVGLSDLYTNGSLEVYEFKNNNWESMGSSINGTTAGEKCGSSTAFSANGKILAVASGSFKDESNSSQNIYLGKVRIYKYTNNDWSNIGEIIGLNETPTENYTYDYLGNMPNSISLNYDGTIIATGSERNSVNGTNSGCVRIFEYNESNNNWIQMGTTIRGEIENEYSGRSISLSDDGLTIAIGSHKHYDPLHGYDRGCIRVYKYDNDWKLLSKIDADSYSHIPKLGEKWPNKHVFGKGVALSGDGTIVIGSAPYESDYHNNRIGYVTAYKLVDLKSKNEKFDIIKFGSDINGASANDESGYSVSLNAEGTIMAIGSRNHPGSGQSSSGHVRVYKWNETSWNQIGSDIDGTGYGDHSAWSLSLSDDGHIVAIGAPFNNGHVSIYEWNGSIWNKKGDDINGSATNGFFGQSVSLNGNGNIVAIGATNTNNTGSVNIYKFTDNAWVLMEDTIYGETDTEECGYSVSLSSDGHTVAISAPNCNTNADDSGCIYVYKWNGNSWNIMGSKIYGNYFSEKLGWCVSLSGNGLKLAIGARLFNNKGYVYVYEWLNDEWTRIGNDLSADLATATGKYGKYIDFNNDGTILVIGSSGYGYNGINSGGANVYKWIDNNWKQIGENIYGDAAGDETGFSVSLNSKGNILSIGSRLADTFTGNNAGHVRTYEIV